MEIYSNSTTVDKTASELDTEYPEASLGDKVHCMEIISGSLIYEKTAIGWCHSLVVVTP